MTVEAGILGRGERAPELVLRAADGATYALGEALASMPVLLIFFQLDCQTCQASFLLWDRAFEEYAGDAFQLWAVSLDAESEATAFYDKSGVSFPVLFDDGRSVEAFRLVSTPSHFLIGIDGAVLQSFDAFEREAWKRMIEAVADHVGRPALEVGAGEAPDFRPGCTIH